MVKKPGRMYREIRGQAYTRKEYMGGIPGNRIVQYEMGNAQGEFPVQVILIAKEQCQIRHMSLEAARIAANRYIQKRAGVANYHLKIVVYPHHVLRENKIAVGAGADRISDGMRGSFGSLVGTAARVKSGQKLIIIRTLESNIKHAKDALRKAGIKMPSPCRIEVLRDGKPIAG
ncbi:MAG: 50S ribosomal protein L16 [Methanobacteriota archaeon]|nr:MAG: 50S ribosomal protein L16 [Euryarchaeota archaeon]